MFPGFSFLCRLVAAVLAALPAAATPPKPPLSRLSVVVLTYIFVPTFVAASYREFKFTNHDLCTSAENGRSLKLGKSAAILSFDSTDENYTHKCNIKLQADKDFGLMAYIEDMSLLELEPGKMRCKEYIQFGRDDFLPFFTLKKSERLCGNKTGYFYEEPDGKLLIWLQFSSKKLSDDRAKRLSIVITPYIKAAEAVGSTDYRVCQSGHQAIRKVYFCDDRVNCALDRDVAGDEQPKICRHVPGRNGANEETEQPPMWAPPLNLVSITLVLVSGVVVLVIVLLLISRLRRFGLCCYKNRRGSCELPEGGLVAHNRSDGQALGDASTVTAMVARNHRGGMGGPDAVTTTLDTLVLNNYPMLTYTLTTQGEGGGARPRMGRGTTPIDSEPPPAYHDLFPVGYKFEPAKVEALLQETSLTSSLHVQGQGEGESSQKPDDQAELSEGDTAVLDSHVDGEGSVSTNASEVEGENKNVTSHAADQPNHTD